MKKTTLILAFLSLAAAGSASAAIMTAGYTVGSSLLTSGGETLFLDSAALGGGDAKRATPNNFDTFFVPGTGFWDVGDTVSITGLALPIIAVDSANALPNRTDLGTITFTVRQAVGGSGNSGAGGLAVLGTASGVLDGSVGNTGTSTYYVNFDTPVTFVADSNSTSIGIHVAHSAAIWLKVLAGYPVTKYNFVDGALAGSQGNFSVAGTVTAVPEPATMAGVLGLAALAFVAYRRKTLR